MAYPNTSFWSALEEGRTIKLNEDVECVLSWVDCGTLDLSSGELVACDPFAFMQYTGNPYVPVPPGKYPVFVTLADVSPNKDGSHFREAYATLIIDENVSEVKRKIITPVADKKISVPPEMDADGTFYGFPVDAGTACFADGKSVEQFMPAKGVDWYEQLFKEGTPDSWFDRMDDPGHIRDGIANIILPSATDGQNIIIFHSGWGDGHYPVIGGYDEQDRLIRVHIDFMVVFVEDDTQES